MITVKLVDSKGLTLEANYDHDEVSFEEALLTNLVGWTSGNDVRMDLAERMGDGDYFTPSTRSGRTLTWSLNYELLSRRELWDLDRRISGLFRDGGLGTLSVDHDGEVLHAEVSLDGPPKTELNVDAGYLIAEIPLFAPEAFIYGDEVKVSLLPAGTGIGLEYPLHGPVVNHQGEPVLSYGEDRTTNDPVTNTGNADAAPIYTVVGDYPTGFKLQVRDRVINWPIPTSPQAPVVINMEGYITVGGYDQTEMATVREWSVIEPGETVFPLFSPHQSGVGYCEVSLRPTYL